MEEVHSPSGSATSPNVECFHSPISAPEVFVQGLAGMVNQQDAETIIRSQKYMLQRFEKTNEMLLNCNALSATRFQNASRDFKKHTTLLQEMKKDVDNIFKRIRNIKAKISQQYPQAYEVAATAQRKEKSQQEEEDDEEEELNYPSKSPSVSSMPNQQSRQGTIDKPDVDKTKTESSSKPSKSTDV